MIAVGVPAEFGEEDVKIFIIPDGEAPDPEQVVRWCEARMAKFKVPRYVQFMADFPRTAAKMEVERHKLKSLPNDTAWDREQPRASKHA